MSSDTESKENLLNQGTGEFKTYRMERPSGHTDANRMREAQDYAEKGAQIEEAVSANDLASATGAAASALSNLNASDQTSESDRAYERFLKMNGKSAYNELHGTFEVEKTVAEQVLADTQSKAIESQADITNDTAKATNTVDKASEAAFERFNQQSANVSSVEYGNGLGLGKAN